MSPQERKAQLDEQFYKDELPKIENASALTKKSSEAWAEIIADLIGPKERRDWHALVVQLRERCLQDGYEIPYSITWLIQLGEGYLKWHENPKADTWEKALDQKVPISVLIEGRNLARREELLAAEPDMTLSRMKAWVAHETTDDKRDVNLIEADQTASRQRSHEGRSRAKKRMDLEQLSLEEVLLRISDEVPIYSKVVTFHEGDEVDLREVRVAVKALDHLRLDLNSLLSAVAETV